MASAAATPHFGKAMFDGRYVVLRHAGHGPEHFDLLCETAAGSPLVTWRCPAWPLATPVELTPLGDHRSAYLSYEGPVSGGRGTVSRVERGMCRLRRLGDGSSVLTLQPESSAISTSFDISTDTDGRVWAR